MSNQMRLVNAFKTFVNTLLLPLFKANESINNEWIYFSNYLDQNATNPSVFDVYLDVLQKSGPQTFTVNKSNSYQQSSDKIKTTSGFYNNKLDNSSDNAYVDSGFQLNKTVGSNERSKITAAMFPTKSLTPYNSNQYNPPKLAPKQTSFKPVQQSPSILLGMEQIYTTLSENQLRLQGNSLQITNGGTMQYRFKDDKNT